MAVSGLRIPAGRQNQPMPQDVSGYTRTNGERESERRGKHRVPESGRTRIATKIETHLRHSNTLAIKRYDASEGVKYIYFRHHKSGANMLINLNFVQFYHYILSSVK